MKAFIVVAALFLNTCVAIAQGWGQFILGNRHHASNPPIDAPVTDMAGVRLQGPAYLAQAYLGATVDSLAPIGPVVPFRSTAAGAGYVASTVVWAPHDPGAWVFVEMRVWESAAGATYEQALAVGGECGRSNPVRLQIGDPYTGVPTDMIGLQPFSLQRPPEELRIQTHAALIVTGRLGAVYSLEYVSDLAQTNNPSAWRCLEYLQLPARPYLWVDKSAPATGKRFYRAVAMQPPSHMAYIAPGTFRIGSSRNEVERTAWEGPQTTVIISQGYWMAKYEVTQAEYLAVMGANPSCFTGDANRPVEQVSWHEAVAYCAALTQRERAAGRIAATALYRLPTEAEWEYACRAWTSTRFSHGEDPGYAELSQYAWYGADIGGTTHPVGQKLPNPWGLHDLHGNVWEWCQDWWSSELPGGIVVDPLGPASGLARVIRGGDWLDDARNCRSASRSYDGPGGRGSLIGFRTVLAPGPP